MLATLITLTAGVLTTTVNGAETVVLTGPQGAEVVFERHDAGWLWTAYRDVDAGKEWPIAGPRLSLQTPDGRRVNLGDAGFAHLTRPGGDDSQIVLETELTDPPVAVRQVYSFCGDGRTLRIATSLRATGEPLVIQRAGLFEIRLPDRQLQIMGPAHVSSPVFGDAVFAGIEHPSAWCQVEDDSMWLAQHSYTHVGREWVELPAAVFGSASAADTQAFGAEALRRAFLRYLNTVRVHPQDMHIHYNNWWTMPVPFSEQDVLDNIAELKRQLYDPNGFFFDSYAMDLGWSDPHSVWEISRERFPQGFAPIRDALAPMGCRPGLWVSPSSLYPPALDNGWLRDNGYEASPHDYFGLNACLALGGRYQTTFKEAVLRHAREAQLAHMKFDGFVPACTEAEHGHPTGPESYQPLAEGLMDVFDALRAQNSEIALEPTCFGYWPSPWWLMHVPFVIGPFGDDSPPGRIPCPEWIDSMTTAREIAILKGRSAFLMPSSALQCFDIIVQCPGDFQNHAAMAVARGRWFLSCYINPEYMDAEEWRFFAELVRWARANRDFLQEPIPIGGDPALRQAYGYAYPAPERQLFCLRNPWIEESSLSLPQLPMTADVREVRTLYPRREVLARLGTGEELPAIRLGPYELLFVEVVPSGQPPVAPAESHRAPGVRWQPTGQTGFERIVFEAEPAAYGPSWTSPDGDAPEQLRWTGAGEVEIAGVASAELCLLCEGDAEVGLAAGTVTVDGRAVDLRRSSSEGAFAAAGARGDEEHWVWFLAPLAAGRHTVEFAVNVPQADPGSYRCGAFLRGAERVEAAGSSFGPDPALPLFRPSERAWSRTLAPVTACDPGTAPVRRRPRRIERIDGVYLDSLEWTQAGAGWGEVHRNRSVMGKRMMMGGRVFHRGIGTHAHSRIVYELPAGYSTFAATIGCDQEVQANSVVFVVEGDGRELFRSEVMRVTDPPREIAVPVRGVRTLTLILEDAGDGIAADHGNWAEARVLH